MKKYLCLLLLLLLLLLLPVVGGAQIITTIAGGGTGSSLGDGGPATAAKLGLPVGLAIGKNGDVYIADPNNYRIRKVDVASGIIMTIAGTGAAGYNGDGIPATAAKLSVPSWIDLDTAGNLYIADEYRLRRVDVSTHLISTIMGTGSPGFSADGVMATAAVFPGATISCDTFGNINIADGNYYRIREIDPAGIIHTIAGTGVPVSSGDGSAATSAKVQPADGLCTDIAGNVLFTDANASIRKITKGTGIVVRIAGTGDSVGYPYSGDGIPATTCHIEPFSVAADQIGNFYIADYSNNRIEKVDTFGIIHTIAGTGTSGFSGDGGPSTAAKISYPENVVVDLCGNVYISDFNNKRVRKITYPANPSITLSGTSYASVGSAVTLSANIIGAGGIFSVKWYNKGILFATTSASSVTYTKAMAIDSITAKVFGCSDSSLSSVHVVTVDKTETSLFPSKGGMTCYPNPVRGELHIVSPYEIDAVTITDLLGREVYSNSEKGSREYVLNTASLPPGIYIVKVFLSTGGVSFLKLMKE